MTTTPTSWNNTVGPNVPAAAANPRNNFSAASQSDSSTISGNDFLTLLVTEMKNQDPTSAADPNQYINQLVSVNSLEQLIQINQTLAMALSPVNSGASAQSSSAAGPGSSASHGVDASQSSSSATSQPVRFGSTHFPVAIAQGNLGIPNANPAAERVAQALGGTHL